MKKADVLAALAALAQENRLDTYRLLVQAGPEGMPAGEVATALRLPPNTLSFHFDRLRDAELVTVRRDGRSMIYSARYDTMTELLTYLTANCCRGAPDACPPVAVCKPARGKRAKIPA
jgi:ArsR family transcriptional regulator, arsenate/arsenite/antimonite-responsive transcriptional repressor